MVLQEGKCWATRAVILMYSGRSSRPGPQIDSGIMSTLMVVCLFNYNKFNRTIAGLTKDDMSVADVLFVFK